jgi:hypothetical protein
MGAIAAVHVKLDSLYTLLMYLETPGANGWPVLCIRFIMTSMGYFEGFVLCGAANFCLLELMLSLEFCFNHLKSCSCLIGSNNVNARVIQSFNQLRILVEVAREYCDKAALIGMGDSFFLCVTAYYSLIKMHSELPDVCVVPIVGIAIIVPLFLSVAVPKTSNVQDLSSKLIKHWERHTKSRLLRKTIMSMRPMSFWCGSFYEQKMSGVGNYFNTIFNFTVSLILSF